MGDETEGALAKRNAIAFIAFSQNSLSLLTAWRERSQAVHQKKKPQQRLWGREIEEKPILKSNQGIRSVPALSDRANSM